MRFKAPPHTLDAHVGGEVFTVGEDGFIDVPKETPSGIVSGLINSGFEQETGDVSVAVAKTTGAKSTSSSEKTSGD